MNFKQLRNIIVVGSLLLCAAGFSGPAAYAQAANSADPAERITVTGVVRLNGEPLIGATIRIQGTSRGVQTGLDGDYSIECASNDMLIFSFIGCKTVEVPVNNRTTIDVVMESDSQLLEDVIVIGYGTTTRRRTVGAVDQVKAEALADRSVANLTQALQGTSPGVIVQQRNFDPNDQRLNINIRGIGTMNNNTPLIVIDGLVSDDASFNKLNPTDIESISVLKDASTAAIYGSRGANGVLLVTTKKGQKNQAPTVVFNMMVGMQSPEYLFKKVEGYQNATLKNIALVNAGKAPEFTAAQIRDLYEHGNGEQFQNTILKNALQQNYNVSVSGGSEHSTYMISAGFYDQQSNYVGPNYGIQRINFRTNLTTEYKRLKLSALLGYTHENNTSTTTGNIAADVTRIPSYYYYRQQDPETGKYLVNDILTQFTALGLLEKGGSNQYKNDYININTSAELQIIDGLKLKGVLGADVFRDHRYTRRPQVEFYKYNNINGEPTLANTDQDTEDWDKRMYLINMQLYADYDKYFGKHHVTGLIGASNESFTSEENQINIRYTDPQLGIPGTGSEVVLGGDANVVTPMKSERTSLTSVFGRVGYDYDERYFGEVSVRYDGSSKFEKDLRWGFFPSASAGWRISQEEFMSSYREKVGDLKLRVSYGTLGNQRIGSYEYLTTYEVYANTYAFNNVMVAGTGFQVGSEDLQWEVSRTLNAGIDATFFNDRLMLGFDVFNKNTDHILVSPLVPLIYGTTPKNYNAGEMRTQGWEITVGLNARTGDFRHNLNLSMGDSWNEVLHFEGFESINTHEEIWQITREGLPLRSYYGYKSDGIFQSQEEIDGWAKRPGVEFQIGDLKILDRNGDKVIDDNDWYYLGNAFPRYTFGVNYNLEWKGLDFSVFLQGVLQRDMMVRGELVEPFHEGYGYTMYEHMLDYWTPTNTDARYPRLATGNTLNYGKGYGSDLFIFDGAYMRVKNIMLGYTLPESLSQKIGLKKARLYINAQNLFTFSNISFLDPESSPYDNNMNSGGADSGRNYPILRYYGMGLDITF
ncbi:MAG: TonB-dependent receptor [Prevotellaceae bacterium]|jgi:TonB-linked SusC/RagA family outer membrane protein|nr:TonB-dependent receptor [Prevotellaceae bacterium]